MHDPARILAFDSSSDHSVVGVVAGSRVLSCLVSSTPGAPSEGLLPMIHGCLGSAGLALEDIDALVTGRGPGSFTGTRMAVSTAKGLALGSGKPLLGVSSVEAAALDTGWTLGPVVVALDARRSEILLAAYALDGGLPRALFGPVLLGPGAARQRLSTLPAGRRILVVGDGAAACAGEMADLEADIAPPGRPLVSSPLALSALAGPRIGCGEADDPDSLEPVYSRPPPVHVKAPSIDKPGSII